jgi:hypothetical protein
MLLPQAGGKWVEQSLHQGVPGANLLFWVHFTDMVVLGRAPLVGMQEVVFGPCKSKIHAPTCDAISGCC